MGANRLVESICAEVGQNVSYTILKPQDGIFLNFLKYIMFYVISDSNERIVWCLNDIPFYPLKIDYYLFHNTLLINKRVSGLPAVKRYLLYIFLKMKRMTVVCQTSLTARKFKGSFCLLDSNVEVCMHPLPIQSKLVGSDNTFKNVMSEEGNYVLYPAANYSHKNISFLLQNLQVFREAKMCLVLCIDPIKEFKNDDGVIFLGAVSARAMANLYHSVDAIINVSDTESVGLSLVEAVIFKKPLVSINEEYVRSIVNSFYEIDKLSSSGLQKALRRLNDDRFTMVPTTTLQLSASWEEFLNAYV